MSLDPDKTIPRNSPCCLRASKAYSEQLGKKRQDGWVIGEIRQRYVLIKNSNRAMNNPEGFNTSNLLVGSEGTLSLFNKIKLKLSEIPKNKILRTNVVIVHVIDNRISDRNQFTRASLNRNLLTHACSCCKDRLLNVMLPV